MGVVPVCKEAGVGRRAWAAVRVLMDVQGCEAFRHAGGVQRC